MKEIFSDNLAKGLELIAKKTANSASAMCFYEPKIPNSLQSQICEKRESDSDVICRTKNND